MDGIHADFAIFGSTYEQWSQIQIQLEDFHWNSGLSGKCNADSPQVWRILVRGSAETVLAAEM